MARTRQFYHHTLGMDILSDHGSALKLSSGLSTLVFKEDESFKPTYHFAFNIPCNQFEEAHSWASAILPLLPVQDGNTIADFKNWNANAFYFYDNNQNIVEFIARYDLHDHSSKPFDGSSITSISEIGIVADDAQGYARQLMQDHGLDYFYRQPPQEDFIALGDDRGLFIIVNEQRNWYPTRQPAGKYAATIRFAHTQEVVELQTPADS